MKKPLFVAVALSVFTVTSLTTLAQPKVKFLADMNMLSPDAVPYNTNYYASQKTSNKILATAKTVVNTTLVAIEKCSPLQFKFSLLLQRDVETITNLPLFNFIEDWWATRYRYGGTTRYGIDCSSYTGKIMKEVFGVDLPRTAHEQYATTARVNRYDLIEGDLVFFNTRGGVSHVGLYLGDGFFTHSSSSKGVTINNLDEAYYSKKYIGGGRVFEKSANANGIDELNTTTDF